MADYKAIHGKNIQHVSSDLDNAEGEGQIWFNTTTSDYKTITKVAGAFATGNGMNTGRSGSAPSQSGTQTAALCATGGAPPNVANVEQYDGTSWTEVADVNTARQGGGGAGITTAALAVGGNGPVLIVESWNSTSWTEIADLNTNPTASSRATGTSTCLLYTSPSPRD